MTRAEQDEWVIVRRPEGWALVVPADRSVYWHDGELWHAPLLDDATGDVAEYVAAFPEEVEVRLADWNYAGPVDTSRGLSGADHAALDYIARFCRALEVIGSKLAPR